MWFRPINKTTEIVLYLFFLSLRTPNKPSRTPGVRVTQVELHCFWVRTEVRRHENKTRGCVH